MPTRGGARVFNDAMTAHLRLESVILPIYREKLDGPIDLSREMKA